MKVALMFLILVVAIGCHENEPATTGINYLNEVPDVIEKNHVYQNKIDWFTFQSQASPKLPAQVDRRRLSCDRFRSCGIIARTLEHLRLFILRLKTAPAHNSQMLPGIVLVI